MLPLPLPLPLTMGSVYLLLRARLVAFGRDVTRGARSSIAASVWARRAATAPAPDPHQLAAHQLAAHQLAAHQLPAHRVGPALNQVGQAERATPYLPLPLPLSLALALLLPLALPLALPLSLPSPTYP